MNKRKSTHRLRSSSHSSNIAIKPKSTKYRRPKHKAALISKPGVYASPRLVNKGTGLPADKTVKKAAAPFSFGTVKKERRPLNTQLLNVVSFAAVLFIFFSLIIFLPSDPESVNAENRALKKMPMLNRKTIFNGTFAKDFDLFVTDNIGLRSPLITLSRSLQSWQGITLENEAEIINITTANNSEAEVDIVLLTESPDDEDIAASDSSPTMVYFSTDAPSESPVQTPTQIPTQTQSPAQTTDAPTDTPSELPKETTEPTDSPTNSPSPDLSPIQAGPLLKFKDRLVELYGFSASKVTSYCDVVNLYRDSLGYNVRVFSAPMPTAVEFIDEKYKSATDSQRYTLDFIKERLVPGVNFVDAYDALAEHKDEYIFFRTDHHWTALGAYYAYTVFAEAAGFEALSLEDDYDAHTIDGFLGYLYNYDPTDYLKKHPDSIVYYTLKNPIETSNKVLYIPSGNYATYSIFMGGDWDYYKVTTSVTNGKTVIILKDSYANAFIPFLVPHYENIVVIDPRTYTGSVTKEAEKYTDVDLVFFDYIFVTGRTDFINNLIKIR